MGHAPPFCRPTHCNRHAPSASSSQDAGRAVPASDGPSRNGDLPLAISSSLHAATPHLAPPAAVLDPDKIAAAILESLDDAKAEEVLRIDLRGKTSIADVMIVASGRSSTHVSSIADRVSRAVKDAGLHAKVEGLPHCDWVLVDAGDVIVHLFRPEVRQFYNLEKLWGVDRPSERQAG